MDFNGAAFADGVDAFVRLGFDVDEGGADVEQIGNVLAHAVFVRGDLGSFADDGEIEIAHAVASVLNLLDRGADELVRVGTFPAWIGIIKELADVGRADCPKERVGDGVQASIAIRVRNRTMRVVEQHAAEPKTPGRGPEERRARAHASQTHAQSAVSA